MNSYKNETGNSDYLIIKYKGNEIKKQLYSWLIPNKPKDKVFNLKMKNFPRGIFLKIQANLAPERNFIKIFNYNWHNRTYFEVFRINNATKYVPDDTYLKMRSFTGQVFPIFMDDLFIGLIKEKFC